MRESDSSLPDPGFGVYLHIPFCLSKCSYCAFSSVQAERGLLDRYVEAVEQEIAYHVRENTCRGRTPRTLYFGGGTPSLTPPDRLKRLIESCRGAWGLADDAEITLEVNPETASLHTCRAWRAAGVTRISLGVQSLDAGELTRLRRPHTPQRVRDVCDQARRAGCRNLSIDLIYGLPGLSLTRWRATVRDALTLRPDHLSAYALTPESGTPVGVAVEEGRLAMPAEDDLLRQEAVLYTAVKAAGLFRYEISNYARPGFECRHNLLYWQGGDWIGLGASAHSRIGSRRWENPFETIDYLTAAESASWTVEEETLDAAAHLGETLAIGVRLIAGIERERIRQLHRRDPWETHGATLATLVAAGLLEPDRAVLRLTPQGRDLADRVAAALV